MPNEFWPPWVVRFSRWMAWISGGIVIVSSVMIGIDVAARSFLGHGLVDSFEITSYGLAISFAFGLPYSVITGAHIRIGGLERFKRRILDRIGDLAAFSSMALFALFLAYYSVETVADSLSSAAKSNSTLGAPIAIPQGLWAFGLVLFAAVSVFGLIRASQWMARYRVENIVRAATVNHDPEPKRQEEILK